MSDLVPPAIRVALTHLRPDPHTNEGDAAAPADPIRHFARCLERWLPAESLAENAQEVWLRGALADAFGSGDRPPVGTPRDDLSATAEATLYDLQAAAAPVVVVLLAAGRADVAEKVNEFVELARLSRWREVADRLPSLKGSLMTVATAALPTPALNSDNPRGNTGSAPDGTPEIMAQKTPGLTACPACNGPRYAEAGDAADRLCAECRSSGATEKGSLLEVRTLIDGDRRCLLDELPHWRELRHFGRLRWGRSEFDANPVELLLDWLAAEHAKPEHAALFTPRTELVELLRTAVAGSDGSPPPPNVAGSFRDVSESPPRREQFAVYSDFLSSPVSTLHKLLSGADSVRVPSCDDWKTRFGEPAPTTLDGWHTLAVRCGIDPNVLLEGSLTFRELIRIAEGYLTRLADAKTSTAPAADTSTTRPPAKCKTKPRRTRLTPEEAKTQRAERDRRAKEDRRLSEAWADGMGAYSIKADLAREKGIDLDDLKRALERHRGKLKRRNG